MLLITPENHHNHIDYEVEEYMIQEIFRKKKAVFTWLFEIEKWFHPELNDHRLTKMEPFEPHFPGDQHKMCPVILKGQLYLFGGKKQTHQGRAQNNVYGGLF